MLTDDTSIEKETQKSRIPQPDEDDMKDVTLNISASDNLPLEGELIVYFNSFIDYMYGSCKNIYYT